MLFNLRVSRCWHIHFKTDFARLNKADNSSGLSIKKLINYFKVTYKKPSDFTVNIFHFYNFLLFLLTYINNVWWFTYWTFRYANIIQSNRVLLYGTFLNKYYSIIMSTCIDEEGWFTLRLGLKITWFHMFKGLFSIFTLKPWYKTFKIKIEFYAILYFNTFWKKCLISHF